MDWLTVTPGFLAASQNIESIVKAKVEIDFTGTDTFVEIPADLIDSIRGTDKLEGTTGYAIANTCTIQFNNSDKRFSKNVFAPYNPSIGKYNGQQQSDTRGNLRPGRKVRVSVSVGVGNEWLQRYAGFVGDSGFVETIGGANSNIVTINCVDLGKYLKDASLKTPGGATPVYIDRKISDPADQGNSLVHIIGGLAGLSPGDIVADTIPILETYSPLTGSAWDELAYLAEVVFATLTVTPDNKVFFGDSRYATGYTPPISQFTFTNDNAFNIGNPDDFANIRNDIKLKFSIPEWLDRQTIWQFKENYDTTTGKCNYVIPAWDTSLSITDPDVEYSPQYGIYVAGEEFEVLSARNISNQAEFESLLETSGGSLDVAVYDVIKYPARAVLRLANNEALPVTLQIAKIKGEPLVRNEDTEVRRDDTDSIGKHGRKEQVIQSKYFTDYIVASGKPHWSDFIQYLLEWKKTPRQLFSWSVQIPVLQAQVGSRVTLTESLAGTGINEIGTVTQITWDLKDGKADMRFSMRWELDNPTPPEDIIPTLISSSGSEETSISSSTSLTSQTFFEDFSDSDVESRWTTYGSSRGELSVIQSSDSITGGKYLSVGNNSGNDERYLIADQALAYDPQKLYRIRVRARLTAGTTGVFYCGIAGRNYDQSKLVNANGDDSISSQHYFAIGNKILDSDWEDFEGYFRGSNLTGNGGIKPNIDDPGTVHVDAKYISPLLLVNYNDQPGTTQVDFVSIDIVPEITNPQITISLNEDHVGASNGKALIYGFDNYRVPDKTMPGFVYINGLKYEIPINSDAEIVSSQVAKGFIIFRYRNGFIFTLSAIDRYVAFVKYENGVWYYDNGTSWQTLTQAVIDDSVIMGTMETVNTPPFQIKTAQVYANPTDIELQQYQDWDAITGTGKAEDNATVGADWYVDLDSIPARFTDSPTDGLNVTTTYMGYYNGTETAWRSFIGNDGSVYFGDGGLTFGSDTFFQWDVSTGKFYLSGDAAFSGTVWAAGNKIKMDSTGFYAASYDLATSPILNDTRIRINDDTIVFERYADPGWNIDHFMKYITSTTPFKLVIFGDTNINGHIIPDVDNQFDIGRISPSNSRLRNIFMTGYLDRLQVDFGGDAIREIQVANITIGANDSVLLATFIGSTNTVIAVGTNREDSTTGRNNINISQATVGSNREVTGHNPNATARTFMVIMAQRAT